MEEQDHIATLCAAGTLGVAATGLALGVKTASDNAQPTTPGKRKWPGASSLKSNPTVQPPLPYRRVVSQSATPSIPMAQPRSELSRSSSLFRRQGRSHVRPTTADDSDVTGSRGSSANRNSLFRPRTADTRSTSERRDPSTGSSWLKRISTVSSPHATSPSAPSSLRDSTLQSLMLVVPENKPQVLPNKLVKRSTSQRALSNDQARGTFLRRPATSHQRSATVQEWAPGETSVSTPATPYLSNDNAHIWRPFFERGYPRKRRTTSDLKDPTGLQTISAAGTRHPTLMLGSHIEPSSSLVDHLDLLSKSQVDPQPALTGRQRLRRSLSSVHRATRRRHFTDPTVKVTTDPVNGTMTSSSTRSPLSPASNSSPFYADLSSGSPSYNSSPPIFPARDRFSFRKRQSNAPSDPTTVSSDNDTRVFTDDDSMDFHSDTAYDSLTTRATVSSHSAFRGTKLDTVFNDLHAMHTDGTDATLAEMVQKATLAEDTMDHRTISQSDHLYGIGIAQMDGGFDKMEPIEESVTNTTPVKAKSRADDDYNMTPVPYRLHYFESSLQSSPPVAIPATVNTDVGTPQFIIRQRQYEAEDDDIDWSPKSDKQEKTSTSTLRQDNVAAMYETSYEQPMFNFVEEEDNEVEKRLSSIFDWSENQKISGEGLGGMLVRPKTVHGKQGHEGSRSRSSGRKGPTQMHLRSQSVPNNRDPNAEQPPLSATKFGTWGLGHKPVSEEWSDDFEFDDVEEDGSPEVASTPFDPGKRSSQRGVKVPQAIIDRQASVHVQFGQVQEFMLLVEELKHLRTQGAALQLLETHSKQLWEDAESIIDLATINNEDDVLIHPGSPTSPDAFGEDVSNASRTGQDRTQTEEARRYPAPFRSVSSPATPPHGRPRGESLAHAKNFLQSIHQSRSGFDSSPLGLDDNYYHQRKLPFDTQDLKDLVTRSGVITRALKEIVRKAEGLSISPNKTPPKQRDPAFSQIFNAPDSSPCPPFRKPGLPKSHSANSYLMDKFSGSNNSIPTSPNSTALVL